MRQLLNIYKPQGATSLEIITLVREKFPEYADKKIGFAGRLDPLAHGVLLLMVGEETTKQKDKYLNLPKAYEFEVVFGIATDTYDALGIVKNNEAMKQWSNQSEKEILAFIKSKLGKQLQNYPPFSSKAVAGKPLFWYAKNNKLAEITLPEREIEIYDFKLLDTNTLLKTKLEAEITRQINLVSGDFRQKEIKESWEDFFAKKVPSGTFTTAKFSIACSSGTYVRSLANEMGAITLDILRTKVGDYDLQNAIRV